MANELLQLWIIVIHCDLSQYFQFLLNNLSMKNLPRHIPQLVQKLYCLQTCRVDTNDQEMVRVKNFQQVLLQDIQD